MNKLAEIWTKNPEIREKSLKVLVLLIHNVSLVSTGRLSMILIMLGKQPLACDYCSNLHSYMDASCLNLSLFEFSAMT